VNPVNLVRTSAFRLTLLFAGLSLACVLVLFVAVELYVVHSLQSEIRTTVAIRLSAIKEESTTASDPGLIRNVGDMTEQNPGAYTLLENAAGQKIAGNLPARHLTTGWLHLTRPDPPGAAPQGPHPLIAGAVRLPDGGMLLVAQDAFNVEELSELLARAFGMGFVLTLVLALTGGLLVSRRILRRLAAVGQAGQQIMHGDLSRRLPMRGTGDEFDQLVSGFNALLDRIVELMNAVRQVTTDIAHDLRTPLSRMRTRLEQLRRSPHAPADYERAIDRTISETEALLDTFAALLRIAQIESASGGELAGLDAPLLIENVMELYQPLAEENDQTLIGDITPARLRGDRELLIQMLANLVENACRHTPPGTRVTVACHQLGSTVVLSVQDNGPGIPAHEHQNVRRRFYRLEASRTTPGSGLGLSLAAAIAARHGGDMRLLDAHPGLRVEVRLPAA
jgi:signal transduction histidine kinase